MTQETNFEQISKTNARFKQKILSMKNYVEKFLDQKPVHDKPKNKSPQIIYSQRKPQLAPNSPQFSNFNSTLFKNQSMFSNNSGQSQIYRGEVNYVPHQTVIMQQQNVNKQQSLQRDKDIISRIDSFMNSLNISTKNITKYTPIENSSNKISNRQSSNSQFSSSLNNFDTLDYSNQINITPRTEHRDSIHSKLNKNYNQLLPPRKATGNDFNKNKLKTIEEELKNTLTIQHENENKKKQRNTTPIKLQEPIVKNTIQLQKAKIKQAMSAKKKINDQLSNQQSTISTSKQNTKKEKYKNEINQMNIQVDFELSDEDDQQQPPIKNVTHQKTEKLIKNHSKEALMKQKEQLQKQLQQIEKQIQLLEQQTIF